MKYLIILGDGMADYPIDELGGKTPLMAAHTPAIDELARKGRSGRLVTVPEDMPPGSEIANMAVLGYDVRKVYQGRGVLEAASMGIDLKPDDLALRCNLICVDNGILRNHSAGHIESEQSHELIDYLEKELGSDRVRFHKGVSYRHLLIISGGKSNIECTPPHDVPGSPFADLMVSGGDEDTASLLNNLILRSQELLKDHPVNVSRMAGGQDPANSIWPWSPGYRPEMKTLKEMYGISGAMISAVDLLYGIGAYAGMKAVKVEGSTGLYTTNYEGKAQAAVEALKEVDLVYLHIEASDEAGHEGDYMLKKKTIEYLDSRAVKLIMKELEKLEEEVTVALIPDHATPCSLRTHTHDPVPFVIYRPGAKPDDVLNYDEESAKQGSYGLLEGDGFMKALLGE